MYRLFETPDQENQFLPVSARSVLPALTSFDFWGVADYLEELVARIDAPRLSHLSESQGHTSAVG
jgi:hypothetical protein